jgi:AcrR family transcriptional regulator
MKMNKSKTAEPEENKILSKTALRRQREREHRYRSILSAAERLIAREGYLQASMERIADSAEVSVGTLYFYFKNKEDLLVHLLDKICFELRELLGSEFIKADFSLDGIKNAGHVFFEEFCLKSPEKLAILFKESMGRSNLVEEHRKEIFDKLIADVQDALVRLGEKRNLKYQSVLSPEIMAVSILGMYERIAYHFLIWQDRSKEMKTISRDTVAFILGGINNIFRQQQ